VNRSVCRRITVRHFSCGRYSPVGITTRYGLDDPGIESWWGRDFSVPVQIGPRAHHTSCTVGAGSFSQGRGVKAAGAWRILSIYLYVGVFGNMYAVL
jgi:hypothetical protein